MAQFRHHTRSTWSSGKLQSQFGSIHNSAGFQSHLLRVGLDFKALYSLGPDYLKNSWLLSHLFYRSERLFSVTHRNLTSQPWKGFICGSTTLEDCPPPREIRLAHSFMVCRDTLKCYFHCLFQTVNRCFDTVMKSQLSILQVNRNKPLGCRSFWRQSHTVMVCQV